MVYFIQGLDGGPIKIGFTTKLEKRLAQIQAYSPIELKILCHVDAWQTVETYLHKRFKKYRLHGEWFEPAQEILDLISEIKANSKSIVNLISFIHEKYGIPMPPHANYEDQEAWKFYKEDLLNNYKLFKVRKKALELGLPNAFPAQNMDESQFPEWLIREAEELERKGKF